MEKPRLRRFPSPPWNWSHQQSLHSAAARDRRMAASLQQRRLVFRKPRVEAGTSKRTWGGGAATSSGSGSREELLFILPSQGTARLSMSRGGHSAKTHSSPPPKPLKEEASLLHWREGAKLQKVRVQSAPSKRIPLIAGERRCRWICSPTAFQVSPPFLYKIVLSKKKSHF